MTIKELTQLHRHAPKEIYLQIVGDDLKNMEMLQNGNINFWGTDITWCKDQINDTDVRYVRVLKRSTAK